MTNTPAKRTRKTAPVNPLTDAATRDIAAMFNAADAVLTNARDAYTGKMIAYFTTTPHTDDRTAAAADLALAKDAYADALNAHYAAFVNATN